MHEKVTRFYLHFFALDHVLGVLFCTLGFVSPGLYLSWCLSPASALESNSFMLLSLAFFVHIRVAKLDRGLYLFPAYVIAAAVIVTLVSLGLLQGKVGADASQAIIIAAEVDVVQDPIYLGVALGASVFGLVALAGYVRSRRARPKTVSSKLRHLQDTRRQAAEGKQS